MLQGGQTFLKWIERLSKGKEPNGNLKNEKYNNSLQVSISKMEMIKGSQWAWRLIDRNYLVWTSNRTKHEKSLKNPWDNQGLMLVLLASWKESARVECTKVFKKIMTFKVFKLGDTTYIQIWEAQRTKKEQTPKKPIPRHIIVKLIKTQDKGKLGKYTHTQSNILLIGKQQFEWI